MPAEHVHDRGIHQPAVQRVPETKHERNATTRLLGVRPVAGRLGRAGEHPALQSLAGLLGRGVVDLLEDARDGEDERRFERLEVGEDGLQIAGQAKRHVAGEAEELHVPCEHMRQGQEQQQTSVRLHGDVGHGGDAGVGDEDEVGVGQFDALRRAGRPGCVHDGGEVGAFDGLFTLVELRVGNRMAVFDHRVDGVQSDDVHVAEVGAFAPHGFDFVALPVILGEGHDDVGIVEDHAHLRRGVRFIDGYGERADGHDGHIERGPLPAGVRDDGDRIPRHDSAGDQSLGDGDHLVAELLGGERTPFAPVVLVFDQGIVGSALRALLKHRKDVSVRINALFQRTCVLPVHRRSPRIRVQATS